MEEGRGNLSGERFPLPSSKPPPLSFPRLSYAGISLFPYAGTGRPYAFRYRKKAVGSNRQYRLSTQVRRSPRGLPENRAAFKCVPFIVTCRSIVFSQNQPPASNPPPEQEFDKRKSLWKGRDVFEEVREKRGGIPLFLQKNFPSLPNAFLYFANGSNTVKIAPPPGFRA